MLSEWEKVIPKPKSNTVDGSGIGAAESASAQIQVPIAPPSLSPNTGQS